MQASLMSALRCSRSCSSPECDPWLDSPPSSRCRLSSTELSADISGTATPCATPRTTTRCGGPRVALFLFNHPEL